jgi:FkbM family methyltransferase
MERALRKTAIKTTLFKLNDRWVRLTDEPHSKTLGIVYHEMAGGFYEPLRPIQRGDNILDIGAHVGAFTIPLALRNPYANFYCVEPNPQNYVNLHRNLARYKLDNVFSMNVALGDGSLQKAFHNPENTGSSQTFRSYRGIESQPLSRLVRSLEGKVSLLKMDCEGAEHEGLDNLKGVQTIIAEIHEKKSHQPGMDLLERISNEISEHRLTYQPTGRCWERGYRWISPGAKNFP